ncbi:YihY/virulence factor BrkB family protein [Salinigranum sp. GCM10025319]|uniref:YihY/virulence factor BrkB family protein n=1 Tax=Salinigranum sp. GCM10025319 TaxID=3252687 RepID=UPI00360A687E
MGATRSALDGVDFVRAVVDASRDEHVTFMAGSLAYHAFVSLVPLAALVFLALAVVGSEPFAEHVLTLTGAMLSPEANALLRRHVVSGAVSGTVGASLVGGVTIVWGALKLFRGLDTAFSEIYDTARDTSFVEGIVDGLVVLVTVPVALLTVVAATTALSLVSLATVRIAMPILLVCGLSLVFLPLYYVFPDADVSVREVLPGVVVAAVGWMVLQQLFHVYVLLTGNSAGSVVGAVILSLTWLYFAGVVLLVGGVVNAVRGGYHARGT